MANLIKNILFVVLLIYIVLSTIYFTYTSKLQQNSVNLYSQVSTKFKGKPRKIVYITKNQVKVITKTETKVTYVPSEGNVVITQPENNHDINVYIKNKGFTVSPGLGVEYNLNKFNPVIDMKLVYWNRYGMGISFSPHTIGLFLSRHIDDFVPFKANNTEIFLKYNVIGINNNSLISLGLRTNF